MGRIKINHCYPEAMDRANMKKFEDMCYEQPIEDLTMFTGKVLASSVYSNPKKRNK